MARLLVHGIPMQEYRSSCHFLQTQILVRVTLCNPFLEASFLESYLVWIQIQQNCKEPSSTEVYLSFSKVVMIHHFLSRGINKKRPEGQHALIRTLSGFLFPFPFPSPHPVLNVGFSCCLWDAGVGPGLAAGVLRQVVVAGRRPAPAAGPCHSAGGWAWPQAG